MPLPKWRPVTVTVGDTVKHGRARPDGPGRYWAYFDDGSCHSVDAADCVFDPDPEGTP